MNTIERCAAGRQIYRSDDEEWVQPCQQEATETLRITDERIRVRLCEHHLQLLVEAGVVEAGGSLN